MKHMTPASYVSAAILLLVVAWAFVPWLFTSQDPLSGGTTEALLPPSGDHWFGTDAVGRDMYTRVVYGSRQTLLGALVAVAVGFFVGTLFGVLAGVQRGWLDTVIMRFVDVLLSVPGILLSLFAIILLGNGTFNAAIAVGITSIATFARLARSEVLSVVQADFVEAAYGAGGTKTHVLVQHILPNSLTAVVALAAVQFGNAILQLSTLGFLGFGAPPPIPEWGLIIAESRDYIATAGWLTLLPGLIIAAVVIAANNLSRTLQKAV